jgi:hypothetical protein
LFRSAIRSMYLVGYGWICRARAWLLSASSLVRILSKLLRPKKQTQSPKRFTAVLSVVSDASWRPYHTGQRTVSTMSDRCDLGYYPFPERRSVFSALRNSDSRRRKRTDRRFSIQIGNPLEGRNERKKGSDAK